MIPCLYDISETEYTTNGIGKLADCISCVVTEKRNDSYELAMEYPSDGIHADELTEGAIIYAKPADNKSPQAFRIYKITTPMDGKLEVAARHISYQLNFITCSPVSVTDSTADHPARAFEALKDAATTDCPFSFVTDLASEANFAITEPTSFRNALGGIDGSMLDTFGGEFEWDMFTVNLWESRGSDNGVRIVYGKNLIDFKMEKSIEDTITGVHPYWVDPETGSLVELPEKIVTVTESDMPFDKIAALDCSSEFEEEPTEDELRAYAQSYLLNTDYIEPDIDMDIDFAQLWQVPGYEDIAEAERVSLCDTVHVYISKLGIEVSAKVTETEYDVLLERYKSITLSNSTKSSRHKSLVLSLEQEIEQKIDPVAGNIVKLTALANGKTTTYYSDEMPEGTTYTINDIWFDTSNGYAMYYWTGEEWEKAPYGTGALGEGSITTSLLAAGCVTAGKIAVDELSAIVANVGELNAGIIHSTAYDAESGEGMLIDLDNGIININNNFTADADGLVTLVNATMSGTMATEDGKYKTLISGGIVKVYYDGEIAGKLASVFRTDDEESRGVTVATFDKYLSLGYGSSDDILSTNAAYILNNGLNPDGRTERHYFNGTTYFTRNIHFPNQYGIQAENTDGTLSDIMFMNDGDNLLIGNSTYVNRIYLRAKNPVYASTGIHTSNDYGVAVLNAAGSYYVNAISMNGSDNVLVGHETYVKNIYLKAANDVYIMRGDNNNRIPEIVAGYVQATLNDTSAELDIDFDYTFAANPYVVVSPRHKSNITITARVKTVSTTGCTIQVTTGTTGITPTFNWIAMR